MNKPPKQKTIELHRSGFETQEEADRTVAYWATRGIKIVWGVPTIEGAAAQLKLPADHPKRECPGCKTVKNLHYAIWRQAIRADGKPARFLPFCRKCEDDRKGFICRECNKHRPGSLFKTTENGRRLRTCTTCRERPLEKRKVRCTKCTKRRPGTEFRWKNEDKTITAGACKPCEKKLWGSDRKPRASKPCSGCKQIIDRSDFPMGPNGKRRSWYCNGCTAKITADTPRACASCHETKPAEHYGLSGYRAGERKSVCKPCTSRVTAYKNRRKRQRAAQAA